MVIRNPRGAHSSLKLLSLLSEMQTAPSELRLGAQGPCSCLARPHYLTTFGSIKTRGRAGEPAGGCTPPPWCLKPGGGGARTPVLPAPVLLFPSSWLLIHSCNGFRTSRWGGGMMARVPSLAVSEGPLGGFQCSASLPQWRHCQRLAPGITELWVFSAQDPIPHWTRTGRCDM